MILDGQADFIGECMEMAPDADWTERSESNNWSDFERIDWRDRSTGSSRDRAVKLYRGSGAGAVGLGSAENVRPPAVLQLTHNHLVDYCFAHERAHYDPDSDDDEAAGLTRLWSFLHNRYRAVRRDFTYQVNASLDPISVAVHEQQARFFIFASHQLCLVPSAAGFEKKYSDEV
jgi:hypothetical protein